MSAAGEKRLVVGDDGSATAEVVWGWIDHHPWPGWTISVVSADDAPDVTILPPDHVPLTPWDPPEPRRLTAADASTRVEHLVGRADPRVVLDSAGPATLMVVGPRGRGLLKQLGVGSTSDWLLQRPVPPVAIIRSSEPTRRVVVVADGTPHVRRAVECLTALPWIASCEVVVVGTRGAGRSVDAAGDAADRLREVGVAPATQHVRTLRRPTSAHAAALVLREVQGLAPDLLALGVASYRELRRAFLATKPTESTQSLLVAMAER